MKMSVSRLQTLRFYAGSLLALTQAGLFDCGGSHHLFDQLVSNSCFNNWIREIDFAPVPAI